MVSGRSPFMGATMERQTVIMDEHGHLTLPEEVRRELGLHGATAFSVQVDAAGRITLEAALEEDEDDAWAYTPEHRALLARAHEDSREGRVRRKTREELERLLGLNSNDA